MRCCILSYGEKQDVSDPDSAYLLPKLTVPIFDGLISAQGMTFAWPDKDIIRKAVAWADLVHVLLPFALSHRCIKIAQEMHKPYTGAFHVQPENTLLPTIWRRCSLLTQAFTAGFIIMYTVTAAIFIVPATLSREN